MTKVTGSALAIALASVVYGQVQHGAISVVENDAGNAPTSVTLTRVGGFGGWTIVSSDASDSSNRGDYVVDFGTGSDAASGVLIVGANQTRRNEPSVPAAPYFATPSCDRSNNSGRYWIAMHETPGGGEVNFNPSFAWFPIADGWLAGALYNSANNMAIDEYVGSPLIQFRAPNAFTGHGFEVMDDSGTSGQYRLSLEGFDLRRDGVLLASGAKNEDNRVDVYLDNTGQAIVHCIDNGAESGGENDPAAFVFIPAGTPGVTMGRVTASGRTLFRQGNFNVEMVGQPSQDGTFRITIDGEAPATGTLIATPHSELDGITVDNAVFVRGDGDGWIVQTRDIGPDGLTLQDLDSTDVAFHFAFFPNDTAIVPPVTPLQPYKHRLNDIISARFHVTEFTGGNALGEMRAERVLGSDGLDAYGDNRGDVAISYFDARLAALRNNGQDTLEGFLIGTPTEFLRDNSATGGAGGWSTLSIDNGVVRTHNVNGAEINSDFALAFFSKDQGLQYGADIGATNGHLSLPVGGDALGDGVLMAINWDNSNRTVTAVPAGGQYQLTGYEADTGAVATDSVEVGYVYLPYELPWLTAGHIDSDGNVLSGVGDFEVRKRVDEDGFGVTVIDIAGVDANADGVLLVTPTDGPYAMAWETRPAGAFEVAGIDLTTGVMGRTGFMFAYVPFEVACSACTGDFNGDCTIDILDAERMFTHLGTAAGALARDGDLTGDTAVDMGDVAEFQRIFAADCFFVDNTSPPELVSPADEEVVSGSTVALTAQLADPNAPSLDLHFFGRSVSDAEPFTIVALPDTQFYSQSYPAIFSAQTQWILDNREALNIVYVAHLGDIVNTSTSIAQWQNANAAISLLDSVPELPYGLSVGNHDEEPCCSGSPGGTTNFNTFFPYTRYEGVVPWYGGHFGTRNDQSYYLFSGGGVDFIAIHFEFDADPPQAVLDWADDLLKAYPERVGIVVTHYLTRTGDPAPFSPQATALFAALKNNPNLAFMLGGHIHGEGIRREMVDGRTIYALLADYQGRSNGGDGWLRIMEYRPGDSEVVVQTYSPTLDQYEVDVDSFFSLPFDMSGTEFTELGVAPGATSQQPVNVNWSGLTPGRYEWYVEARGPGGVLRTAARQFVVE